MPRLSLINEFQKVANEEKFTMLCGKLFQTFTTRSVIKEVFSRVGTTMVNRELVRIASSYGVIAIGRLHCVIVLTSTRTKPKMSRYVKMRSV